MPPSAPERILEAVGAREHPSLQSRPYALAAVPVSRCVHLAAILIGTGPFSGDTIGTTAIDAYARSTTFAAWTYPELGDTAQSWLAMMCYGEVWLETLGLGFLKVKPQLP